MTRPCRISQIRRDLRSAGVRYLAARPYDKRKKIKTEKNRIYGIALWGVTCGHIFSGLSYAEKRQRIEQVLEGIRRLHPAQTFIYRGNTIYITGFRKHLRNVELSLFWSDID